MNKNLKYEVLTKAQKREIKSRRRMPAHGATLKKPNPHAGKKLSKR